MMRTKTISIALFLIIALATSASAQFCGDSMCNGNETIDICPFDCKELTVKGTNLFGKIIDSEENPVAHEEVTAYWTDEFGDNRTTKTQTLSKLEAEAFGNRDLEGFFLFTDGNIKAAPQTEIEVRTEARYTFTRINAQPGQTRDIGELAVFGVVPKPVEVLPQEEKPSQVVTNLSKVGKWIVRQFLRLLLVVGLIVLIVFGYLQLKRVHRIKSITEFSIYQSIKGIAPKTLNQVMTKKVITVRENDSVQQALQLMIEKHVNCVVVTRNEKPMGILTEMDFLKKVYSKNADNLKVSDIMTHPTIHAHPSMLILDALHVMLSHKIRKLPILKNRTLVGFVTLTDISRALNESLTKRSIHKITLVDEIYKQKIVRLERSESIQKVIDTMIKDDTDYVIVYEYVNQQKNQIRNIGIVTTRDLLEEYYKNNHMVDQLKASHTMSSPIISTNARANVIDANHTMLDKNFRRLPILEGNKLVGIITQDMVLESLHHFILTTKKQIDDYKKIIK